MSEQKVFFITGASRGLGVDLARAALDAGHAVVATGRSTDSVAAAIGAHDNLLVAQLETNFFGPLNVTRAVLPVMRAQRSGHVVSISSLAGLIGQYFCSAYAASKFALEGWMESLAPEIEPFGISTTVVEPGFFRTELLSKDSTRYAEPSIEDYRDTTTATIEAWSGMSGQQGGDPAKLARALVTLTDLEHPPARWVAGSDAIEAVEGKARQLLAQVDAHRTLSSNLAHN